MSPEIQEWSHKSRSRINNLYLLTRPISMYSSSMKQHHRTSMTNLVSQPADLQALIDRRTRLSIIAVHRCLQGMAPQYLIDCCIPISDIAIRQRLRSATGHRLIVPRHRRSRFGRRAFSVAGPMVWNLLPDHLRDPSLSIGSFRSALKTFLFTMHQDT